MSMRSLEAAILWELREVTKKRSIRQKDIQEWSTGTVKVSENETHFFLPMHNVNVAVLTTALGKRAAKKGAVR